MLRAIAWFEGRTTPDGERQVLYAGKLLDPRFDIRNHSPAGFNWGYGGSGPAQLALAMLCAVLGDDQAAEALYQDFKFAFIGRIETDLWLLDGRQIVEWVESDPDRAKWLNRN